MERILLMLQRIGTMVKSKLARAEEMVPRVTSLLQDLVAVEGSSFDDKLAVLSDLVKQGLVTELQSQIAGESLVALVMQGSDQLCSSRPSSNVLFPSCRESQAMVSSNLLSLPALTYLAVSFAD